MKILTIKTAKVDMNKKSFFSRVVVLLVGLILVFSAFQPAEAAKKKKDKPAVASRKSRPWIGFPWMAGCLLTGGTIAVGLKNSKRTQLTEKP